MRELCLELDLRRLDEVVEAFVIRSVDDVKRKIAKLLDAVEVAEKFYEKKTYIRY